MHKVYDSIILGSGISGLSIAWWLRQQHKRHRILIVDRKNFLDGASAKNAGFLTVGSPLFYQSNLEKHGTYIANEILDFCQTNHELLHRSGLLTNLVDYRYNGSFTITSKTPNSSRYEKVEACDFSLSSEENCYFYRLDGSVNPIKLLNQMRNQINVDMVFETSVTIEDTPSKIHIGANVISYKNLFIANNAWFNQLYKTPEIRPIRAQIFRTHPVNIKFDANYYFSDELIYFRQDKEQCLLVGGKRLIDEDCENTDVEAENPKIQAALEEFVRRRLNLDIEVQSRWSGIMGFTQAGLPATRKIGSNIYYQAGFSGHGMGMAFHCAMHLTRWALKGKPSKDLPRVFVDLLPSEKM